MASSEFGVTDTGFIRPTEEEIVTSIQACFPDDLNYKPGSLDLALLEMMTKIQNDFYEVGECIFNGYNFKNLTGCALEVAAGEDGFTKEPDETDQEFIQRICNAQGDGGFVTKLEGQIRNLPDVCRVRVYNNDTGQVDPFTGNPGCSYEVVYEGGDPKDIAAVIWPCTTGASNLGTETCRIEDKDGRCREVRLTAVQEVPYCIRVIVDVYDTSCGCDGQTFDSIRQCVYDALTTKDLCSLNIGDSIHSGIISGAISSKIQGISVRSIEFAPSGVDDNGDCTCENVTEWTSGALNLGPRTIPTFDLDCICIVSRDV